jgi:glutathione synthase/RimK-type ligase-like ATP-grasp enzyme
MRAISVFDQAAWMNFPQATYLAECKPYQLITAFRCGFKIPETIVGNDVESIKNRFKKKMVLKSLDTILLREGDDCLFTYTTINEPERFNDDLIYSAPLLAQELLSEKTDIRVTLVGNEIFSVRILSRGKPIAGDWRTEPRAVLEYQDFQLPRDVEMACRNLSIRLGLSFSAIDLIETPEGIFFIEVNPTGEWGWISNDRRRIDKAIATWLTQPKSL